MAKAYNFFEELSTEFISGNTTDVVDPITFIEAPWGLNFKLFPQQRFLLKCFYGMKLDNSFNRDIIIRDEMNETVLYQFNEREFLDFLYDSKLCNTNQVEGKKFVELLLVTGRRGTKTSICSAIGAYELYKLIKRGDPSEFFGFPPDTKVNIVAAAPTDEQASVIFDMMMGHVLRCPYLKDRSINQTQTYFNLQTDADKKLTGKKRASVTVVTGGCSSNSLRGPGNIIVIMDEMAFFIDNAGRFSGAEVYKAITPSIASFKGHGKILCLSSPYAKYGIFWDRYVASFEERETTLMFQMYSAMLNPTIDPAFLKRERKRDKFLFMTEYAAKFSDNVMSWVDDEKQLLSCVDVNKPNINRGETHLEYFLGLDLAAKNDGTAIAVGHRDSKTNKIIVDYADVYFSGSSDIWDMEKSIYARCNKYASYEFIPMEHIANEVEYLCKWFPIRSGWFDQWSGYALLELLHNKGLKQFYMQQVTDQLNAKIYGLFKSLYSEQLLVLPNDQMIIDEILQLEAELKNKSVKVRAPNKKGAHDDISDAISRCIWDIYNNHKERGVKIVSGVSSGDTESAASMNLYRMNKAKLHGGLTRVIPTLRRKY